MIGTEDTPIRHYFLKDIRDNYEFDFQPQFISVVWILNPMTSSWEYLNSYSSTGN
ncbi:MAG: hypothetical protein U5L96_08470 [Owenweeksia sp.]|nr:hypothetical protein [Owenweeksia sp.]